MNEGCFRLFLKAKIGIFLNYRGADGGAGRITPSQLLDLWANISVTFIVHTIIWPNVISFNEGFSKLFSQILID